MPATILFPSDPLHERRVDPEFEREWDALRYEDVQLALVDHDALVNGGEVRLRNLPETGRVLYRGWMVTVEQYILLANALLARGLTPVTDPEAYASAHQLPAWLDTFEAVTPQSAVIPLSVAHDKDHRNAALRAAAHGIGGERFIVKDYVKSRKHEWATATYAPSVDALPGIAAEFIRLQDEFLVGGLVVRQFIELDKSLPEYRVWWTQRGTARVVGLHPDYPAEHFFADQHMLNWLDEVVQPLVARHGAPFVVTDVAVTAAGGFVVIEVGDGQVSGMPRDLFTQTVGEDAYAGLIASALTA